MSLTPEERAMFALREELTPDERDIADACMSDIVFRAKAVGLPIALDDRAGRLEAALVRYLIESRPNP